jgi:hypothetical protein
MRLAYVKLHYFPGEYAGWQRAAARVKRGFWHEFLHNGIAYSAKSYYPA